MSTKEELQRQLTEKQKAVDELRKEIGIINDELETRFYNVDTELIYNHLFEETAWDITRFLDEKEPKGNWDLCHSYRGNINFFKHNILISYGEISDGCSDEYDDVNIFYCSTEQSNIIQRMFYEIFRLYERAKSFYPEEIEKLKQKVKELQEYVKQINLR
jgi:uncharacterized coiled-coil protein SlyX